MPLQLILSARACADTHQLPEYQLVKIIGLVDSTHYFFRFSLRTAFVA
jgi:hypothetical protein